MKEGAIFYVHSQKAEIRDILLTMGGDKGIEAFFLLVYCASSRKTPLNVAFLCHHSSL